MYSTIKIQVQIKAYHPYYISRFLMLAHLEAKKAKFADIKFFLAPHKKESFTVLRSPHVDKKARDQFERITHKHVLLLTVPYKDLTTIQEIHRFLGGLQNIKSDVALTVKIAFKN
jgi:small subunit ribosomal protein S10